jgi:hypothetical protein
VSVSVFEALVVPSAWLPKARVEEESFTGTTPVPVNAAACGLVLALSVTVRVAASLPRIEGV